MNDEERERTTMDEDLPPTEDLTLGEQERAAAVDAGRIGGPAPDVEGDEASRPLEEAGQGVAEGFEQSERELVEQASHGDDRWDPQTGEFPPETESDRATAAYSEADELDVTESTREPSTDG